MKLLKKDSPHSWTLPFGVAAGFSFLAVAAFTNVSTQVALLGFLFCVFAAIALSHLYEEKRDRERLNEVVSALPVPFASAREPGFFKEFAKICDGLTRIVAHRDLLFLDLCRSRLEAMAEETTTLAGGQIVFHATETWRTAYQHVLETLRVKTYYSVAWVRTNGYWDDAPGRQSMRFNYDLIARGFRIERIHILSDDIWPFEGKLPGAGILEWLVEQQGRGIHVSLVRESALANEQDLLRDFAVYGDRATGSQELDEQSRTQRFILSFDEQSNHQALARWERLKLFATSFQDLMDRLPA